MKAFAALIAAFVLAAPAAAQQPMTYYAGPSRVTLPLTRAADGKVFVQATVQGQPATLLIDTGGSQFLDLAVCNRLGLKLTDSPQPGYGLGSGPTPFKTGYADMRLGGLSVTGLPVSCIEMTELRALHKRQKFPDFDGIVGSELMAALRARLDYDRMIVELRRPTRASMAKELQHRR
ncbi:hypothetical protein G7077_01340 [Sphingomonas piscis]|uniref:Peptidase A2 domain-containing protein n=1 Tax=Sphingomonas piscis TaxID=2714943 RepID=A0A6G7YM00_9SPHN|nr:retropepsin-like aspartic protease [Sphingomonas piscis]QIK77757.1 hypothetical protein G7077_01340 [Sphingomonas piscis]